MAETNALSLSNLEGVTVPSISQETTQQETDNQMMRKGGRVRTKPVRRK